MLYIRHGNTTRPGKYKKGRQNTGLTLEQVLAATLEKNLHWNARLRPTEEDPYPLAPAGLAPGELTPETYEDQNSQLAEKIKEYMTKEIIKMAQDPRFKEGPCGIEILGAGLLRDLKWLKRAVELEFEPMMIRDVSDAGVENATAFTEDLPSVGVDQVEVEAGWADNDRINDETTLLYYAGQFIHHQSPEAKDRMMEHFGKFIGMPTESGLQRKVYLLTPLGDDPENDPENNPKVQWRGKPYTRDELRKPLEEGFGGPVDMEIVTTHMYFYHRYSLICISAPDEAMPVESALPLAA